MSNKFGGLAFYEYHRAFSARSASLLQNHNIKINWELKDTNLFCMTFAGHTAISCGICNSKIHTTQFCPQSSQITPKFRQNDPPVSYGRPVRRDNHLDTSGRVRVMHGEREICNNFNSSQGCSRLPCSYSHVCTQCKKPHPSFKCMLTATGTNNMERDTHPLSKIRGDRIKDIQHKSSWLESKPSGLYLSSNLSNMFLPSTPINILALEKELTNHPNPSFVDYLLSGIKKGFHTGVSSHNTTNFESKHLQSAIKEPDCVSQLLSNELESKFWIGPFSHAPFKSYRVSPIGLDEHKYSHKKRLIVDLSAPHDNPLHPSINDMISKEEYSLSYVKIDDAIKIIKKLGIGSWMCKVDVQSAFKILLDPNLWHLYGIRWNDRLYFATRLVFGSRSSPKIFDQLVEAV